MSWSGYEEVRRDALGREISPLGMAKAYFEESGCRDEGRALQNSVVEEQTLAGLRQVLRVEKREWVQDAGLVRRLLEQMAQEPYLCKTRGMWVSARHSRKDGPRDGAGGGEQEIDRFPFFRV